MGPRGKHLGGPFPISDFHFRRPIAVNNPLAFVDNFTVIHTIMLTFC